MDRNQIKDRLFTVVFESDTRAGKIFDISLLVCILLSVIAILLESIPSYSRSYGSYLYAIEWGFTIIFTIEYGLRLYSTANSMKYAKSFFGIIDLLSILPTYLGLIFTGAHSLMIIRLVRVLRIFRIFKLTKQLTEGRVLLTAFRASSSKIMIFLMSVLLIVCVFGTVMYLIEGPVNASFDSIPRSIYWCIVTVTTVGYGDISPVTSTGQFLASILMICGYAILAVPTGIMTGEIIRSEKAATSQTCPYCTRQGHDKDAVYCKYCGKPLHERV
ncbi:MAG: ion transporter [Bacteroidales bacterium]